MTARIVAELIPSQVDTLTEEKKKKKRDLKAIGINPDLPFPEDLMFKDHCTKTVKYTRMANMRFAYPWIYDAPLLASSQGSCVPAVW